MSAGRQAVANQAHETPLSNLIITASDHVPGRTIESVIGPVEGSSVRARVFVMDIIATIRVIFGGEVHEYAELLRDSRARALQRLSAHARAKGADAVITMRYATSAIAPGTSEILAYGTAVTLIDPPAGESALPAED